MQNQEKVRRAIKQEMVRAYREIWDARQRRDADKMTEAYGILEGVTRVAQQLLGVYDAWEMMAEAKQEADNQR